MKLEIKAENLRGNSWSHMHTPGRMCPLEEALKASGFPNAGVGAYMFEFDEKLNPQRVFKVPEIWNRELVEELVKKANEGSEESYFLELPDHKEEVEIEIEVEV